MINIYDKHCFGITLFRWFSRRIELWFILPNYKIIEHTHGNEDIELMFLFGKTIFYRRNLKTGKEESLETNWKLFGKKFSVKYFHSHWFSTNKWPLIFINFQKFLNGKTPCSAAKDLQVTR